MKKIDLKKLTKGEVAVLLGYDYGVTARSFFNLDELDAADTPIQITLPPELDTIAPSFVQGFFGKSAHFFGNRKDFFNHYSFVGWPQDMITQIDTGLARALMDRSDFSSSRLHA
jgi:hypothetical protein